MMIAMSPELKIVNGTKGNEPDKDLLEQKLMHPSRITEFVLLPNSVMREGKSTGLAIMSKDNEPRVSFAAYLLIILIGLLVYGAYNFGHSNGRIVGKEEGHTSSQMQMLMDKLDTLEKEKAADERQKNAINQAKEVIK